MATSPIVSDADVDFEPKWGIESPSTTMFDFNYTGGRDQLLRLYDKGTRRQWIGSDRLDWSQEVDLNNPGRHARRDHPDLRHGVVGQHVRRAQRRSPPALRGLALQPVHARRAGCADLHGQDRADGARRRLEVLRGDPGHRRGAPRRGLQPLPAREGAARLPAQPAPQGAARRRHLRQPLGHDLSGHAGAHRGAGPGRLRRSSATTPPIRWPRRSTPT